MSDRRGDPRNGRPYRRLIATMRAMGASCVHCRQPIDPALRSPHPLSFTIEHVVPISQGGLALNPANCLPAHRRCNEKRGVKPMFSPHSRIW
ncbi:5-methylcytosine-specific restriction endonuclease McrA [Hamadaea flava]|uniref:HNH endonuclease n=1 Tax=Hamadaea flava TaxID=1742688 RepID=A0ABV8LKT7_9ACTN|nr:HNH endonuclease [Hamadaea flava]MCP2324927.1 5-methylcytosine-specific restriction endonuclease McrA [Hamadaea flava]